MAVANAEAALVQQQPYHYRERLTALTTALNLTTLPQRLECFDVSHLQGEATVASCVVFDHRGACPQEYRRFNIEGITPSDDVAALQQALTRRYRRLQKEKRPFPDILFIDGGYGQVRIAQTVLQHLNISPMIRIIGIAKGVDRRHGQETLILSESMTPLILAKNSPALHLIQWICDTAHRFAITAHRQRRAKIHRTSVLEQIEGIGPQRRKQLINYFGGLQGVSRASIEDLSRVPGINKELAQKIYHFFINL
jgi:excinuclease ABC subunit C